MLKIVGTVNIYRSSNLGLNIIMLVKSVFVMLVMLECFEELVVLGERLGGSCLRHVEVSIVELLSPECGWFLSFVADVGVD
jgi:hypothetical protein